MRNPNTRLPNRNTLYLGRSGSGKSTALKHNPAIPGRGLPVAQGLRAEIAAFASYAKSEDFREGLAAFAEKRPPAFKGWDDPSDRGRIPTLASLQQDGE
mgnify:CR=1 FL=1